MGEKVPGLAQWSKGAIPTAGPRQGWIAIAAWLAVGLATALVTITIVTHGREHGSAQGGATQHRGGARPAVTAADAALTRSEAAGWIARQLSPTAIVACDPQMCSTLQAAGLQASRLLMLRPSAANPQGAEVVVATLAVRSQFGSRLASVYAPELIAGFGSGATRIEIRYVPPDSAPSSVPSTTADRVARAAAGQQLLRNQRIYATGPARAALTAGSVDPRLLVTLAVLAAQQQVSIAAFADASPGTADVLLRSAEIGAGPLASMQAMQSFLLAQRPPYLPAQARLIPASGGRYLLSVQFYAPSPLGLASEP